MKRVKDNPRLIPRSNQEELGGGATWESPRYETRNLFYPISWRKLSLHRPPFRPAHM